MIRKRCCLRALAFLALLPGALAAQRPVDLQIEEAVDPLPRGLRNGATVLGYLSGSTTLAVIREGDNAFICLADEPGSDRFQVSCYHRALEPYMARGRELRAQGLSRDESRERREREILAGTLPMAMATLYSLYGTINPVTGRPDSVNTLRVLYMPYATIEDTGLPPSGAGGRPWLMSPGSPRAHLMIPGERRVFPDKRRRRDRRDPGVDWNPWTMTGERGRGAGPA